MQVRRQYKTGVADRISVVSPLPAPFTLPTYQITPQACPNNNVNLDVTVLAKVMAALLPVAQLFVTVNQLATWFCQGIGEMLSGGSVVSMQVRLWE
ncbi:MAG: hypothetical protein IPJ20_15960 [Flammeovirgaceae bacterium]|nr:hypothetical protein [Flammeovirgaceae bacterium]